MSLIKKWSTGKLGNDHDESVSNTRGLDSNNRPGVEAYIPEDLVIAEDDNRPLKNLSSNDSILENNLSDVASEVDRGVLRSRYEEFDLQIMSPDYYPNPEDYTQEINTTPIRIKSGSMVVDGQVTRLGNQKLIYFVRLDDEDSILFVPYQEGLTESIIEITDENYDGRYSPVYSTIDDELPSGFETFSISITNTDSQGLITRELPPYNMYRDWEEIVPFPAESEEIINEVVSFDNDQNFGQFSEGYRLQSGGVIGTKVSEVEVKKNISIIDKVATSDEFLQNGSDYEYSLKSDGLFFDSVYLSAAPGVYNKDADVQSLYVDKNKNLYFINRDTEKRRLYFKSSVSKTAQLRSLPLSEDPLQVPISIRGLRDYIVVTGKNGLIVAKSLNVDFSIPVTQMNITTTQPISCICEWDNKIWAIGETSVWYSSDDIENFNPTTTNFVEIDLTSLVTDPAGQRVIKKLTRLLPVQGVHSGSSSLETDKINYLTNNSFEYGGLNNKPADWFLNDASAGSIVINTSGLDSNYKAVMTKTGSVPVLKVHQDYKSLDIKSGDIFTFSIYLRSSSANNENVYISELDKDNNILHTTSSQYSLTGSESDWTRFYVSHTVSDESTIKLRVEVGVSSLDSVQLDNAQLERGLISEYIDSFDFLMVGFEKEDDNATDPPFFFFDRNDKYTPKYTTNNNGQIKSVNASLYWGNNQVYFADDNDIYSMVILNERDEYDRYTVSKVTHFFENDSFDFSQRIEKFEFIEKIDNKLYFGGTVKNKVVKAKYISDFVNHEIDFEDVSGQFSLLTLLGGTKKIDATSTTHQSIEFVQTNNVLETDSQSAEGKYVPNSSYHLRITIDNKPENTIEIIINSPPKNSLVWPVEDILFQIKNNYISEAGTLLEWQEISERVDDDEVLDWRTNVRSSVKLDGFYSLGANNITTHISGNVHGMYTREELSGDFYLIRDNQIFISKVDKNLIKDNSGSFNAYDPEIVNENYEIEQHQKVFNKDITFNQDPYNKNWMDIPVDEGYQLKEGSLRVKTSILENVGYVENKDYFVDYQNNKIILNNTKNLIKNSDFQQNISFVPTEWSTYNNDTVNNSVVFNRKVEPSDISNYFAGAQIEGPSGSEKLGAVYQIIDISNIAVAQTYVFSIEMKSLFSVSQKIRIVELSDSSSEDDSFDDALFMPDEISYITYDISGNAINKWNTYSATHTVSQADTTRLRVEVLFDSTQQIQLANAQLERNIIATPYVKNEGLTRIDPQSVVFCDYIQYRALQSVDYTFDTTSRKLILKSYEPKETEKYYLKYKYEKIFNAHDFEETIPISNELFDENEDYFIFLHEGRIWAINQIFALLSLDEEDPMYISYKYHYPRIDAIKIRNYPDRFGSFVYLVKGVRSATNPYRPYDIGEGSGIDDEYQYYDSSGVRVQDILNDQDNDTLYEINVVSNDYTINDIYDRRIYVDAKNKTQYNISLYPETLAYFPFTKDFNSTNGFSPLNFLSTSKIIPIIKYFSVFQQKEVGAWREGYQINLRNRTTPPNKTNSIYVNPLTGSDLNTGDSLPKAVKTVSRAIEIASEERYNIIITEQVIINENIEINSPYPIAIFANTYCYWRGAIKNISPIKLQGIWFQNSDIYVGNNIDIYYCTFQNSTVNMPAPVQETNIMNTEFRDCGNSILRVNENFHPSPFLFPYQKHPDPSRDDLIDNFPENIATSDSESIHPGDDELGASYEKSGLYNFDSCLIYNSKDHLIEFDPTPPEGETDFTGQFIFDHCTIAHNKNLFKSSKLDLGLQYSNCIMFNNKETRGSLTKVWDVNSTVELLNCFVDIRDDNNSSEYNFGSGTIIGRESCIGKTETSDPLFLSTTDYHLQSIARGSQGDSPALEKDTNGNDLGCFDEIREQTEQGIPKKLRSYVASISEGIVYPIIINSEKVTVTLEFKPSDTSSRSGVIFDTRSASDDEDYIVLAYNNNNDDSAEIESVQTDPSKPYKFRVIVKNKEFSYTIVSPLEIYTDEEFKIWHRISFTINYEKIFNLKSGFDEHNKKQNIITLYHNDATQIESFLKYDLNRNKEGEILTGRGSEQTNAWDYNDISQFVTLGSDYSNSNSMPGYYAELRIDNKFIDRKEFDLWNAKKVPFNDPTTYVNQSPLTKSFDPRTLSEYWSLKDVSDIGSKENRFKEGSQWEYAYENSELTWFLRNAPAENLINHSGFEGMKNASVISENSIDFNSYSISSPMYMKNNWSATAADSVVAADESGITLQLLDSSTPHHESLAGYQELGLTGITSTTNTGLASGNYSINLSVDGGATQDVTLNILTSQSGYQEFGLTGAAGTDPHGLITGVYDISVVVDEGAAQNISLNVQNATSGFAELDLDGNANIVIDSGLLAANEYTIDTIVDGLSSTITITLDNGSTTYGNLLSKLNDATTNADWSIQDGNLVLTSDSTGSTSSAAISEVLDVAQSFDLVCPSGASIQSGDYIVIHDSLNENYSMHVWYIKSPDVGTAIDSDPQPWPSLNGIRIVTSDAASDVDIASQVNTVLNNILFSDHFVKSYTSGNTLTITNLHTGYAREPEISNAGTFTYSFLSEGVSGLSQHLAHYSGLPPISTPGVSDSINSVSAAPNYEALVYAIDSELTGATCTLTGGDIRITSSSPGEQVSSILIQPGTVNDLLSEMGTTLDSPVSSLSATEDATWQNVIDELNANTSGATWSIVDGDIRCESNAISNDSAILISAGTTGSDLLASVSQSVSLETPVEGFDRVKITSKNDFIDVMDHVFSQNSGSKIDYIVSPDDKLRIFTQDINASSINVRFGSDSVNSDHVLVEFNDYTNSGSSEYFNWVIEGIESSNVQDSSYFSIENTLHSSNSLVIDKQKFDSEIIVHNDGIGVSVGEEYILSVYIYSEDSKLNNTIKFYNDTQILEWDSIEKYKAEFWVLSKRFVSSSSPINIGLKLDQGFIGKIFIDSFQLEKGSISTPYIENYENRQGGLIVSKNLINNEKGVIHFRFNPKFDFYEPREDGVDTINHPPRILFETKGLSESYALKEDEGITLSYHFDIYKNRGVIDFSINDGDVHWQLDVVETYWYQWHTVAVIYDFTANRFVLFFDYYSEVFEIDLPQVLFGDLYIGRGAPIATRSYSEDGASIEVKDIILTDYPVSDAEIREWHKTYEFFNYSQIINSVKQLKSSVDILGNQVIPNNIFESRLISAENDIYQLQSEQSSQDQQIANINNDIDIHDVRIANLESDNDDNKLEIININSDISTIYGGAPVTGGNLSQLRSDLNSLTSDINSEISNRALEDQQIRSDLASTSGASYIGVDDAVVEFNGIDNLYNLLLDFAGPGRTNENLYDLSVSINNIEGGANLVSYIAEGSDTIVDFTESKAVNDRWNIRDLRTDVDTNVTSISTVQSNVDQEVSDRQDADQLIRDDLASDLSSKGASMIGIEDISTIYSAVNVEEALSEIAGVGRTSAMTVAQNSSDIQQNAVDIFDLQRDAGRAADYIVGPGTYHLASIQGAIDQATTDGATIDNPKIIYVMPGLYTEDIVMSPGINVIAAAIDKSYMTKVVGTLTYDCSINDVFSRNLASWVGVDISNSTAVPTLSFSGTNPQRLNVTNCEINSGSTQNSLSMTNSGSGSVLVTDNVNFNNTSTGVAVSVERGKLSMFRGQINSYGNSVAAQFINNSQIEFTNAYLTGQLEMGAPVGTDACSGIVFNSIINSGSNPSIEMNSSSSLFLFGDVALGTGGLLGGVNSSNAIVKYEGGTVSGDLMITGKITSTELVIPVADSDVLSPTSGHLYYNSTTEKLRLFDGTAWVTFSKD